MGEQTKIEWADYTFNPWIGCTKVAPGCANCYAEADMDKRRGRAKWGPRGTRSKTSDSYWKQPLAWNARAAREHFVQCVGCGDRRFMRTEDLESFCPLCGDPEGGAARPRVFCASLADVFEDWSGPIVDHRGKQLYRCVDGGVVDYMPSIPHEPLTMDDLRRDLFAMIDATPNLDWLLLTKRPESVPRMWVSRVELQTDLNEIEHRPNVWLLTSVSDQATADRNIPHLLACRDLCPVLGLSAEPLLGPMDLRAIGDVPGELRDCLAGAWRQSDQPGQPNVPGPIYERGAPHVDWVIVGGESGPNARPMHPEWARSLRDQCTTAGVAYFFKQWGEWLPYQDTTAPMLEGQDGQLVDRHTLPPAIIDHEPVDGWYWPCDREHLDVIYRRVGKRAAGRLLDGRTWDQLPEVAHEK